MFLAVAIITTVLLIVIIVGEQFSCCLLLMLFVVVGMFWSVISNWTFHIQSQTWIFFPAFKDRPPTSANRAQEMKENGPEESYMSSIKNLMTNKWESIFSEACLLWWGSRDSCLTLRCFAGVIFCSFLPMAWMWESSMRYQKNHKHLSQCIKNFWPPQTPLTPWDPAVGLTLYPKEPYRPTPWAPGTPYAYPLTPCDPVGLPPDPLRPSWPTPWPPETR